ncbi:MAG: histidine kinase [Anaerolineae bacterium]|nr:histidine kinase [Anaerolineae bacterium]
MRGTALYNNLAFIERYGYTVNDLNLGGIPETLFVNPDVARAIFQAVQRGESWNGEVRLKTRHGEHVSTLVRADRIADNTGTPIGIISVYSDITELKHAQAAERAQRVMAEALRDISTALTSTLDLGEVLDRILDNVGRVVPHDAASIIMIDDDGRARFVRSRSYTNHAPETASPAVEFAVADYAALRWMAENEQPLVIEDVQGDPTWGRLPTPHRRAYVGAPIHLRRKVIGFLGLHSSTPGYFSPTHAERLQAFAGLAAIALQNALFHDQAQELAALEERQRLARNLHDAVNQMLFSASVIAEALPHLWERDPERVRPQLAELHKLTRGALAEMRMLLMELRPTVLQEAELNELLQQLTDALAGSSRLAVSLTVEGASTPPPEVRVALYYIAQEALNNVVKHAHAKAVTVHLQRRPDAVRLRIADDGRGFDVEHAPSMSLGLGIMRERADAVGASLQLTSAPGAGAQVEVVWSDKHGKEPI